MELGVARQGPARERNQIKVPRTPTRVLDLEHATVGHERLAILQEGLRLGVAEGKDDRERLALCSHKRGGSWPLSQWSGTEMCRYLTLSKWATETSIIGVTRMCNPWINLAGMGLFLICWSR